MTASGAYDPRRIILASRSPRRRQLLEQLGFRPVVRPAHVDERQRAGEGPLEYVQRLAEIKASAVSAEHAHVSGASPFVVSADTVVVLGEHILEKPDGEAQAREMLRSLSDRWHRVVTAFHVRGLGTAAGQRETRAVEAQVRFRALGDDEIGRYVASGEPMDKAGAYGIQGIGGFLVREVHGSYFAVVGLPICELVETLKSLGAVREFPFASTSPPPEVSP